MEEVRQSYLEQGFAFVSLIKTATAPERLIRMMACMVNDPTMYSYLI